MTTISRISGSARTIAHDRQLDWLLDEVLGGEAAARHAPVSATTRAPASAKPFPWLAAGIALLAAGVAVGVAVLRGDDTRQETQDPKPAPSPEPARAEAPFVECHGAAELARVPADVTALHCFDFDDAACARLATFPKLERLDLSSTDADDRGVSIPPRITDAGVRALAPLTGLRWLRLARSHAMQGQGLHVLEGMPRLEHLDLTYSGVTTTAVERLARLPSLRTLVLSHNLNFHGSALAAVATLPGLRRLELQGCPTLAAADVLPLTKLRSLRHLDLRDCQGSFRGQTLAAEGFDDFGAGATDDPEQGDPADLKDGVVKPAPPPKPPVQDGIGITDDVVQALAALPLETFLLGGSESLTDAIGPALAQMTTLRTLDLANLPKTTGALLAEASAALESLSLDDNRQLPAAALEPLLRFANLRVLGLRDVRQLGDRTLQLLLERVPLQELRLGSTPAELGAQNGVVLAHEPALTVRASELIAGAKALERLALFGQVLWLDAVGVARIAALPRLRELTVTRTTTFADGEVAALRGSRSLQALRLSFCMRVTGRTLVDLVEVPLRELDLYATNCDPEAVRELATKHWPGCVVTLPNGQRFVAPR